MRIKLLSIVSAAFWIWVPSLRSEGVREIVRSLIEDKERVAQPASSNILREIDSLLSADPTLAATIESNVSRVDTTADLMWAAASQVSFNQQSFRYKYPFLTEFGHLILVSKEYFNNPRIIYQTDTDRAEDAVQMLYGKGAQPLMAPTVDVTRWSDPEDIIDLVGGKYSFELTIKGPYLLANFQGHETTGATSIRNILYWVRVEDDRLVPERLESYDVPIGATISAACLKKTSVPVSLAHVNK